MSPDTFKEIPDPDETRETDAGELRCYTVPTDDEPMFMLDTTTESFTVEWIVESEYDADRHMNLLCDFDYDFDNPIYRATFEGRRQYPISHSDDVPIDSERDWSDCTYVRAEEDNFSIEWEADGATNRVLLSGQRQNGVLILLDLFRAFYQQSGHLLAHNSPWTQMQKVIAIIQRDCEYKYPLTNSMTWFEPVTRLFGRVKNTIKSILN